MPPSLRLPVLRRLVLLLLLALAGGPGRAVDVPLAANHVFDASFGYPSDLALADLDRNGTLDPIGISATGSEVAWWNRTTLWTKTTIFSSSDDGGSAVAVGDVDGDGDVDVLAAVGLTTGHEIVWFENDGSPSGGGWTKNTIDAAYAGTERLATADMDGDGDLDLLAAGNQAAVNNSVVWWVNDGTPAVGTWTKVTIDGAFDGASSVAAADMDRDGDLDVVATATNDNLVAWWESDGDPVSGTWTERTIQSGFTGGRSIAVSDLDGDGDLDIVGAASGVDDVAWWENNGTGGDPTLSTWPRDSLDTDFLDAWFVTVADIDQDGDPDVLATAFEDNAVVWWENDGSPGDGGWTERTIHSGVFLDARTVLVGDLDQDGDPDILNSSGPLGDVGWWENETIHRSAVFTDRLVISTPTSVDRVDAGDVDGDGDLDLVSPGSLVWHENTAGNGSSWTGRQIDADGGIRKPVFADVDGDGDLDVIAEFDNNEIHWWQAPGDPVSGTWTEHVIDDDAGGTKPSQTNGIEPADFDGDGDLDVAVVYSTPPNSDYLISWWENPSDPVNDTWTEHVIEDDSFVGPLALAVADFDGDGDPDVASVSVYATPRVAWWANTSNGTSWSEATVGSLSAPAAILAGSFNKNGGIDIVSGDAFGSVFLYSNTLGDASTWSAGGTLRGNSGSGPPNAFAAADFDLDGDLDLALFQGSTTDQLVWLEDPDAAIIWPEHIIEDGTFNDGKHLIAADIDGDGDPDLVGVSSNEDEVAFWRNEGGQLAFVTTDSAPATIPNDESDDVLEIEAVHRGRSGDGDGELVTFELLLDNGSGTPLDDTQANNLIERLGVFRDDPVAGAQGIYDGADDLVAAIETLALTAGVQTVSFVNDSPDVQVAQGTPETYFVVAKIDPSGSGQTPNSFSITHVTEASSSAQDAANDIPLIIEYAANVGSSQVTATGTVTCYALSLSATGGGQPLAAAPTNSAGCPLGEYVAGETIGLTAVPDPGWIIDSWSGTEDDASTATTNTLTMPAMATAASVTYVFPDYVEITGLVQFTTTEVFEACIGVTTISGVYVEDGGDVTLRAGSFIEMRNGLRVYEGGTLTADTTPPTPCIP